MSCCGKRREALRQARAFQPTRLPTPAPVPGPRAALLFTGRGAYLVAGPASKEVYHVSAGRPELAVDPRDVTALVGSGLFRLPA